MNEPEKLDLSALDTSYDPARWQALVEATMSRVDDALARRPQDPLSLIASWSRPLLVGTAVTIAMLVPVEFALEIREVRAEQVERLVTLSEAWGTGEVLPSGAAFVRALGERSHP